MGGLCDRHRCSAQYCSEPRITIPSGNGGGGGGRDWDWDDGLAYDEDGPLAPFCRTHGCRRRGCMQQTVRDSPYCLAHARCELDRYEVVERGGCGGGEERIRYRPLSHERSCSRDHEHDHDCGRRPRYRECPGYRRHPTTYASVADEMPRPSRPRMELWRRGYARDMDDEWRWPLGI